MDLNLALDRGEALTRRGVVRTVHSVRRSARSMLAASVLASLLAGVAAQADTLYQFHELHDIDGAHAQSGLVASHPITAAAAAAAAGAAAAHVCAGGVFDAATLKGNVTLIINVASF